MGAAGNGAFAGKHRTGRKVGTIRERHGAFRKEISRTVPAVANLLLCALEIPPVVDVGGGKEYRSASGVISNTEQSGLYGNWKGDALDGIEAAVDHEPGGVEVAGLCSRQDSDRGNKLVEPSLAVFPFKAIRRGRVGDKETVL